MCSINGGDSSANVDPESLGGFDKDPVKAEFWQNETIQTTLKNMPPLAKFNGAYFDVLMLVGGFGVMFDFFPNEDISRVGRETWESDGIVAAVCHGPIGLASIKLSDGSFLVNDKNVAGETIYIAPLPIWKNVFY
jgi:putative intracellular protease/amidase